MDFFTVLFVGLLLFRLILLYIFLFNISLVLFWLEILFLLLFSLRLIIYQFIFSFLILFRLFLTFLDPFRNNLFFLFLLFFNFLLILFSLLIFLLSMFSTILRLISCLVESFFFFISPHLNPFNFTLMYGCICPVYLYLISKLWASYSPSRSFFALVIDIDSFKNLYFFLGAIRH